MIYFDVTSLASWKGPPVGVIRTVLECARWLACNASAYTAFCAFDAGQTIVFPVQETEVRDILERPDSGARQLVARSLSARSDFGLTGMLAMLRRKIFLVNGIGTPERKRVAFTGSDVYVSVGLDWDVGQFPHLRSLKQRTPFKAMLMCHDVVPIKYPHLCLERVSQVFPKYLTDLASLADCVICNSSATQKDLVEVLLAHHCPVPSTMIIRLGAHQPAPQVDCPEELLAEVHGRPFILYVSTIEKRKNHEILYKAYVRLREEGASQIPLMVFVGMRGWGVEELLRDISMDPRVRSDFLVLKRVSEPSLAWLYRNCLFTVFPSLYEGWGIPVRESLAYGKFCIASDRGALPEAGGSLVEYLDPWDVVAWARALHRYSSQPQALREQEKRIKSDFVPRTWDQFGEELFHAIQSLTTDSGAAREHDFGPGRPAARGLRR